MSARHFLRLFRRFGIPGWIVLLVVLAVALAPLARDYAVSSGLLDQPAPGHTNPAQRAAAPAGIDVSAAEARAMLVELAVAKPQSMGGYDRDAFAHWNDPDGNGCDAREDILQRDGAKVRVGESCRILSGQWNDPFTDATITDSSLVDVDHVVPLAEAWRSGAQSWGAERRRQFANDPRNLIATSQSANRSKGDKTPATWMPPARAAHQSYAIQYVAAKHAYRLSVTSAERAALTRALTG